jgi:hypothetical protein
MRQLFVILLTFLFIQCAEEPTAPTIEEQHQEDTIVVTNAIAFNEYLSIRVNTIHELLEQLQQADDNDEGAQQLIDISMKSIAIATEILAELTILSTYGEKGEELLQLTISYVESKITIMEIYKEFAAQLAIPESEWTNEDFDAWMSNAEPYFGVSEQIMQELLDTQQFYLSVN